MASFTNGESLQRMSSFDRLMSSLSASGSEDMGSAAEVVQSWYRRRRKMSNLLNQFTCPGALKDALPSLLAVLHATPHMGSLDETQHALSDRPFREALNAVLCTFPRDPGLKARNKQCRSAQFVSLAVAIHSYGNEILVTDDMGTLDTCLEAKLCKNAASLLTLSFLALLEGITSTADVKVNQFRSLLLMYRFNVRYFLSAMDKWKKVDGERLARDMEEPYRIAYKAVLWATNVVQDDASASSESQMMLKQAQAQLDKMRFVFERTMGKVTAKDKMEELEATENLLMAEALSVEASHQPLPSSPTSSPSPDGKRSEKPLSPSTTDIRREMESGVLDITGGDDSSMSDEEMRYLERLAKVAGMENERIAHELTIDPSYSLGTIRADFKLPEAFEGRLESQLKAFREEQLRARASGNPPSPSLVKTGILAMMGDTLQWSIRKSPYFDGNEVLEQLEVGAVLPINYQGKVMSAALLSIDAFTTEAGSPSPTLTVEYLTDGGQESGVPLTRLKTISSPTDPDVLLMALTDIVTQVANLTPTRVEIRERLQRACDVELLRQMLSNDACSAADLSPILGVVFDALQNLLEPSRAVLMGQWRGQLEKLWATASLGDIAIMLPYIFETMNAVIEEVKREMANYFVELLGPMMQKHGREFLRLKLESRISGTIEAATRRLVAEGQQPYSLSALLMAIVQKTAGLMLPDTHPGFSVEEGSSLAQLPFPCRAADMQEIGIPLTPAEGDCVRSRGAVLMVRLLQVPVRLNTPDASGVFPEIYLYDADRLAAIRDDIDIIALLATLLISLRQCLHTIKARNPTANSITLSETDLMELHSRLDALLRNPQVSMPNVTTEMVRFVRNCNLRCGLSSSGLGPNWEETLEASLRAAVKAESPMLSLFSKRLYKVLLRALVKKPYTQVLASFSLGSAYMQRAIQDVVAEAEKLLELNVFVKKAVYTGLYDDLK